MIYIKRLNLPSQASEDAFTSSEMRTCFPSFYPFKIFPMKELDGVEFDTITMFYGGNGSGKSTLINVLARKMNAVRFSDFNDAPFFDDFVNLCRAEYYRKPEVSYTLSSDDVFDYVLRARTVNENIDDQRNACFYKYADVQKEAMRNPQIRNLRGLKDFDRWKEAMEILSPKRSQSRYIRNHVARDIDLFSNGETALRYFLERIDGDAVYLLDEPENSLSVAFQLQLCEYIEATARATRSQFIIATHSPILLSMEGARIYNLDEYPADVCRWTELPNVRKYFDFFMEHREEFEEE